MAFRKIIAWIFWPLSIWYGMGVALRNFMFSMGIKKQHNPHITTIGVGNLIVGGTGKTPHVEYLLRLLGGQYRTALLSRGYKRKTSGFVLANEKTGMRELGDEPAMIHDKFPQIITAVCEKRWMGIQQLMQLQEPPELVVMDDVYQHRQVKPTLNILLTEYSNPYFNDRILPFGNLREFKSARNRANIIIVTKSPQVLNPLEKHALLNSLKTKPYQKVFFSYLSYGLPINIKSGASLDLKNVDNVLLVTGIANPKPMQQYVANCCKVEMMEFVDHYNFKKGDITRIIDSYKKLKGGKSIILTTEKDKMRLEKWSERLDAIPVYYLPIEVKIHQSEDYNFDNIVNSIVKENISFIDKLKKTPIGKSWG